MKKILPLVLACLSMLTATTAFSQDIPLYSQKMTNAFIYNPAMAGHTYGSVTYSFKQNYANVEGSPQNHFLSVHTPVANHRFGIGASVYQEDVTFLRSMYASAAFAYHIPLSKLTTLSFGLSGELNSFGINGQMNFEEGGKPDPAVNGLVNGIRDYDFSFGTHFQNRYLKAGIASNRLATTWIKEDGEAVLSNYFSSFVQGLIPLRNSEDLLEPYIAFRKLSDVNEILDFGLYYTYNDRITTGASMRSGKVLSGTLGFRLSKYIMFGYSREIITGNVGGLIGAANEFTIRFDFNDESYKDRFSADYKSSVAYRRKTLSTGVGKPGGKSPKQLQKKQKKLAPYSPNLRYQNTKKLSVKKSPAKYNKKRKVSAKRRKGPRR